MRRGRPLFLRLRRVFGGRRGEDTCPHDLPAHTLAAVFNRAGYLTMRTCKDENSYMAANAEFAVRRDRTMREGNDERGSAWHAEQVLDFLNDRETAGDDDPFLIDLGFSHPHDPREGREKLLIQIKCVLDPLDELGAAENTHVLFTSDHGIAVGRHGLVGKQSLYEHCWRVPFLAAGPDIPAGTRAPGFVYLLDVLPTLCDLAGIEPPETVEGMSFAPVLRGERQKIRDVLYGVYSGEFKLGLRAVRRGDRKLIKYDSGDGLVRETQLFNLAENPDELLLSHHVAAVERLTKNDPGRDQRDLAEDPAFAEVRAGLEELLRDKVKRHDDPYTLWDQAKNGDL